MDNEQTPSNTSSSDERDFNEVDISSETGGAGDRQEKSDAKNDNAENVDPEEEEEERVQIQADESAIEFLQNVDPEMIDLCLFEDQLVTTSPEGKTIGEFKSSVQKTEVGRSTLLLVHAASHGKVDDIPTRTSFTAYLKPLDLSLVKQEHYEFIKIPGHELEKRTEMTVCEETGQLTVNRRLTQGDRMKKSSFKVSKEKLVGFATEATSILIERLMMKLGYEKETLTFLSVDPDESQLVTTSYTPVPPRNQQIGSKEHEVFGIERRMQSSEGIPHTWQSFFLDDGHLTMRLQIGSPVLAVVEKLPRRIERAVFESKPVFEKQPLDWENDMEMKSRFIHRKEELKAGHETYLRQHPEASALLSDFFQFLLLRKPDDVVGFAADFFGSFSNVLPDLPAYSHSSSTSLHKLNSDDAAKVMDSQ